VNLTTVNPLAPKTHQK